jgi:hypothetical protein
VTRTPHLHHEAHRRTGRDLPPQLIPDPLTRVPQECPRPDLDQPAR